MILSAAPTESPPAAAARKRPALLPIVILLLIAIVVVVTGVGVVDTLGGPTSYACMGISHQGSGVQVTTTGLIHYLKSAFYITCNEGSPLPTSLYKMACLTITPQTVPATIGVGASTEYYYISAGGNALTLQGAPAPTNGTEIITPAGVSLQTPC